MQDFEVFIDNSTTKEVLKADNKTTVTAFVFGDKHTVIVKKKGHEDANKTDHIIQDPENVIDLYLPKKQVCQK